MILTIFQYRNHSLNGSNIAFFIACLVTILKALYICTLVFSEPATMETGFVKSHLLVKWIPILKSEATLKLGDPTIFEVMTSKLDH